MATFNDLRIREYPEPENLAYRGRFIHNWFSNFDKVGHPVEYRGQTTMILELAFVAAKNPDAIVKSENGRFYQPFIERVFSVSRPGEAKKLGSSRQRGGIIDLRPDWDEVNVAAMDYFLRQRWQPGTEAFDRLMNVDGPIVEWNNWGDNRWGVTNRSLKVRNALGILLDGIRADAIELGEVPPGAEEENWGNYQDDLIARLNDIPTFAGENSPEKQLGLFQ